jgi:TonB family protein
MNPPAILTNLLSYSLQLASLVTAGALFARLFPGREPRVRLAFWQALLATVVLLPAVQPWRMPAAQALSGSVAIETQILGVAAASTGAHDVATLGLAALASIALARLLWIAVGFLSLARLRRRAKPVRPLPEGFCAAQRREGTRAGFFVSDDIGGPLTFGLWSPAVVVPPEVLDMPAPQQEAIVSHELAHVRRRDWAAAVLEEVLRAVLWFHPAMHWLVNRIRLEREQAVDREVVRRTASREAYLDSLVTMARTMVRPREVPGTLFLKRSHLGDRIELLLQEVSMSKAKLAAFVGAGAVVLLTAGAVAARTFPLVAPSPDSPAVAEEAKAPAKEKAVTTAAKPTEKPAVKEPKLVHKVAPAYPEQARKDRIQGMVILECTISKTGEVVDAQVIKGLEALNQAAIEAVRQWRYEPVTGPDKKPVQAKFTVTVNFKLS